MKKILLISLGVMMSLQLSSQCLQNWTYTMPVTVTNSNPSALTNFQVMITVNTAALVSAGHMQASGNDIRFTQGNCCNFLPYTIESGMNTATTNIWVKVPTIPASGNAMIDMHYGNPSAVSVDNPVATFDMWEPFDAPMNHFSPSCGSGTYNVALGNANLNWSAQYVVVSDLTFDMDTVYTVEANVTAASGNWPGVNFSKVAPDYKGYGMLLGSGQVRIGEAGTSASDFCRGENWASALLSYSGVVGVWSATWITTGNIIGTFPTVGLITSTSTTHARDNDMKVCLGGISSGSGSMSVDWVRVRKYASSAPGFSLGSESPLNFQIVSLGNDTSLCDVNNLMFDAGSGFSSYTWSGIASGSSQTTTVNGPGQVIVQVVDASSCPSSDTVNVTEFPPVNVDLGADQTICPDDSIALDAGSGFTSYSWSSGGNAQLEAVSDSGSFMVDVIDVNGCAGSDTVVIHLFNEPTAGFTGLAASLTVSFTNSSTGGTNYYWDFGDGDTSTQASPMHTFAVSGTYHVCLTVTNADGCEDVFCLDVNVTNTGIENAEGMEAQIYPNPAKNNCWISVGNVHTDINITMVDVLGKVVYNRTFSGTTMHEMDLAGFADGVYTIKLVSGKMIYHSRLVIEK